MVGSVVVKPKHKPVPTARQDRSALTAQIIAVVKSAKRIAGQKAAADTVSLGRAGSGGVELYQMFPSTLTVSPGTTDLHDVAQLPRFSHRDVRAQVLPDGVGRGPPGRADLFLHRYVPERIRRSPSR